MARPAAYLSPQLRATFTWEPGEIAAGEYAEINNIEVDGAELGDGVIVSPTVSVTGLEVYGYVIEDGVVAVALANDTEGAITVASSEWGVRVLPAPDWYKVLHRTEGFTTE